jgi:hypothetical protein
LSIKQWRHFCCLPCAAGAATYVSTAINTNDTWNAAGSPYVIQSSGLPVSAGATLTIEAGVIVKFGYGGGGDALNVEGNLVVLGSPTNHVTFTSIEDDAIGGDTGGDGFTLGAPGQWAAIRVYGTASLSHVDIRYGGYGVNSSYGAIHVQSGGTAALDYTSVRYSQTSGLSATLCAAATIRRSEFAFNAFGMSLSRCPVTIREGTRVTYNTGTGIFIALPQSYSGAPISMTNSDVTFNGDFGLRLTVDPGVPVASQPYGHQNNILGNDGADTGQFFSLYHLPGADWSSNYWGDVRAPVECPWAPANTFPMHLSYEEPNPYTGLPRRGPVSYQSYSKPLSNPLERCAADKVKDYPYAATLFDNTIFTNQNLTISITELGFSGDVTVKLWPNNTTVDPIDGTDPTWTSSGLNLPVAYTYNTNPTLFITLSISPALSGTASLSVRAKSGSTTIATQNGIVATGAGGRVTSISVTAQLETNQGVQSSDYTWSWDLSIDGGQTWTPIGTTGPHRVYWILSAPPDPPFYGLLHTPSSRVLKK